MTNHTEALARVIRSHFATDIGAQIVAQAILASPVMAEIREEALAKKIRQSTGKLTTTNFMAEIIVGVCAARAAALRAIAGDEWVEVPRLD